MTWEEWINSSFNNGDFYDYSRVEYNGNDVCDGLQVVKGNDNILAKGYQLNICTEPS